MPYCPRCEIDIDDKLSFCPHCNYEFDESEEEDTWVMIAAVADKTSAEFARETLDSYDIPVAILSQSGFLGDIGLTLPSLSGKDINNFQIYVPTDYRQEAKDVIEMILGNDYSDEDEEE